MKKGERTKLRIAEAAKKLFRKKGFASVTMKDVCEAAEISRGGLYAHFSSTEEMLAFIIDEEQTAAVKLLKTALSESVSPDVIIRTFISKRVREICSEDGSIEMAVSEFAACDRLGRELAAKRAKDAVGIMTEMIRAGQREGMFAPGDPEKLACNLLWMIEGLSAHVRLFPVGADEAEEKLLSFIDMMEQ